MRASTFLFEGLLLVSLLAGCTHDGAAENDALGASESAWGHLASSGLTATAPQFLINKDVGVKYRVCLAGYMTTAFPGVEMEIDAAINAWGYYLGRTIPVEVVTKDLPRATASDTVQTLLTRYDALCGQGFDTVVGLAPLDGGAVGLTTAPYSYFTNPDGSQRVASFKRGVFFKDYDLQPSARAGDSESWSSLRSAGIAASSADRLVATMAARNTSAFVQNGSFLLLPVMAHEFGHVWGMCDQYEGAENCDAAHSTSHIVDDSIMSARSPRQRLFLTDDDIAGVRALAARPGFAHGWGTPNALSAAAAPETRLPLELARIERVALEGSVLAVRYSVVTTRATKYEFAIRGAGASAFTPLRSAYEEASGVESVGAGLNIQLSGTPAASYAVRLRVSVAGDDGIYGAPVEVIQ